MNNIEMTFITIKYFHGLKYLFVLSYMKKNELNYFNPLY